MNEPNNPNLQSLLAQGWKSARAWIASDRLRRLRAVLFQVYLLIAVLAFAALAFLANTSPVFQPDVLITRSLQSEVGGPLGLLLEAVSVPGYAIPSVVLIAATVLLLAYLGLRWEALIALFAGVSSGLINYIIKTAIHRPRPTADLVTVFQQLGSYSFPSGHVMFYTIFFGYLLFITFTLLKRIWLRYLLMAIEIILIALVGVSRMYLGEHWASDVIGGYLAGSLTLVLVIMVYRWGKERQVVHQPIAVTGTGDGPLPPDEKKEAREAVKNPLMPKSEANAAKTAHPELHDHNSDRP